MHSIATRLEEFLQQNKLIIPGSRCLLAVSGGSDSTALLCLMHELRHSLGLTLYAAHFDHQLRPESGSDRQYTEELCHSLGVECFTTTKPIAEIALSRGLSLEEAGRFERYAFFDQIQKQHNIPYLLTAHTADDLAETVLMRLISGTGTAGLGAIRATTKRGNLNVIRPLLIFRKSELCSYLEDIGSTWREDSTNHVAEAPRTKVRLCLLPLLEQWNTKIVDSLGRLAHNAQEDEDYFTAEVHKLWENGLIEPQEVIAAKPYQIFTSNKLAEQRIGFHRAWLNSLHPALRKRLWRLSQTKLLSKLNGGKEKVWPLESCHYQSLENFLLAANGKRLPLINGIQVRWEQNILWWESSQNNRQLSLPSQTLPLSPQDCHNLLVNKSVLEGNNIAAQQSKNELELDFNLLNVKITIRRENISQKPEPLKIWLNPQVLIERLSLCPTLSMRSRLPGDIFFPAGGCGRQKLKKYLFSAGITQNERDRVPLLCCGPNIIWTIGLKADQSFLARPGQTDVISLQASPIHAQLTKGLK
ncbi:MAG: tRNA lysidine(34) synthetase TilS [Candidatus Bruticola sp.]